MSTKRKDKRARSMKRAAHYHPDCSPDNAVAIAAGNLQFLVDYLRELAQIPYSHRNPVTRINLLIDRAGGALIYAEALAEYLGGRARSVRRKVFTIVDVIRAMEGAQEYKRLKGTRPADEIEKAIMSRYGISRTVLRAALKGNLPRAELPGIDSAD